LLAAGHLIRTEVVVDLLGEYLVWEAERAHLLQEILNFDEVELFEGLG